MCTVYVPVKLCIREGGVSCRSGRFHRPRRPGAPGHRGFSTTDSAREGCPGPGPLALLKPCLPPAPHPSLSTATPTPLPGALAPGCPELRRGIVGFSLVLGLPQLPCSVAWEVGAPGAQESGPVWDSNSLPLGVGGSLDWWLEFLERGQG